eukprot:gene16108-19166_t
MTGCVFVSSIEFAPVGDRWGHLKCTEIVPVVQSLQEMCIETLFKSQSIIEGFNRLPLELQADIIDHCYTTTSPQGYRLLYGLLMDDPSTHTPSLERTLLASATHDQCTITTFQDTSDLKLLFPQVAPPTPVASKSEFLEAFRRLTHGRLTALDWTNTISTFTAFHIKTSWNALDYYTNH